jgi:hypothetical protein
MIIPRVVVVNTQQHARAWLALVSALAQANCFPVPENR